jgi:uncharacterized protein (DUF1800 family)
MERLKAVTAVLLCWSFSLPAPLGMAQEATASTDQPLPNPPRRQAYHSDLIQGDDRILHALNRFTFGPRPGDLEAVRKIGLENWWQQQLHPAAIDEKDLTARLAKYPAMEWTPEDLMYRAPNNAVIRQAVNGKAPIPDQGTLRSVYENQIYRLQLKKEGLAGKKAQAAENVQAPAANGTMSNPVSAPAAAKGASQDTSMAQANDTSMAAQPAMASQSAGMSEPAAMSAGSMKESQSAVAQPNTQMANAAPADAQPQVSAAAIREILALPSVQRVDRLSAMSPEDFEAFMKSLKGPQRQLLVADLDPGLRECVEDLENPRQMVVGELFAQRLTRDIYSNAQLQEVMTDFWFNHFNVFVGKDEPEPYYLVGYERDVIRPHSLGKFEDLLESVAHSPAMLLYLDNAQSVGPDSFFALRAKENDYRRPKDKRQAPQGLNENYARELMELHTLGVNGGYTQADVTQVARILTGWTIDRPQQGGSFIFNPMRHEPGNKVVMGQKFKENGEMEGRELLHFLATRPATAQFLSRKLAIRFVSDDPPQALVDRMAETYLSTGGDISAVLRAMVHAPEFWSTGAYRAKVKTPLEYVVSAVRASNANIQNLRPIANELRTLGMPLYGCVPPTGYNWQASTWVGAGAMVDRLNFALGLAANRLQGIATTWEPADDDSPASVLTAQIPSPESEESRLESSLVAGGISESTRAAVLQQFQQQAAQMQPISAQSSQSLHAQAASLEREDQLLAGLLLGSPEFQRR